ncbi:ribokinase [Alkalibacterium iburiense]|uniref:Ribokinase n=1 Tax=Alkalibacterium iburiense TaxID=290589 RepID=A0ABP3H342_9LACT
MPKITVVGSISTDFVVETDKRPSMGETVEGKSFTTSFGGKGANQAVASARLGGEVHMLGAVGTDIFGEELLNNLRENHIFVNGVERVTHPSGSAFITLFAQDNSIIYVPGANGEYTPEKLNDFVATHSIIQNSDLVMVQNETPEETVQELIQLCEELKVPLLLNPAPARSLNQELIEKVAFITPNETEFDVLFPGEEMETVLRTFPNKLIITLGSKGAVYYDGEEIQEVPSTKVSNVVDTTGAGDVFNGAFAFAYSSGLKIKDSIQFANIAAGLSIQKVGAQTGAPTLEQMKEHEDFEKAWHFKQ